MELIFLVGVGSVFFRDDVTRRPLYMTGNIITLLNLILRSKGAYITSQSGINVFSWRFHASATIYDREKKRHFESDTTIK